MIDRAAEKSIALYSLTHLADSTLLRELASLVAQDRSTTAALLADIAEFDARKLCLPAGYPTTFAPAPGRASD